MNNKSAHKPNLVMVKEGKFLVFLLYLDSPQNLMAFLNLVVPETPTLPHHAHHQHVMIFCSISKRLVSSEQWRTIRIISQFACQYKTELF